MKEHAKKALKHDFEVAGKTIPTLAIAALFLVGTGSAALLSSFGTVSGTADVQQSITINSQDVTTEKSWSFDFVAGETVYETNTVNNNLNESEAIAVSGSVESEPSTSAPTTTGDALTFQHALLENGEAFAAKEPVTDQFNSGDKTGGSASAEYVIESNSPAVKASYNSDGGHVHAGLWYEVSDSLKSGKTQVTVGTAGSNTDWIEMIVNVGGTPYAVVDARVKDTGTMTWDGDEFKDGNLDEPAYIYEVSVSDVSEIDSRSDFNKSVYVGTVGSQDDPGVAGSEIHYVGAATGTVNSGSGSVTYTDFGFDGVDLFHTGTSLSAPSGDSELATLVKSDVAAVPGDYTVDLTVSPGTQ